MNEDVGGEITWVLRAGRESCGFWERFGFTASDVAMERVRQTSVETENDSIK